MEYTMTKIHYNAMFAICKGITELDKDFMNDMIIHNVDINKINKIMLTLKLSDTPNTKYMTKDLGVLSYIITYLFYKLTSNKTTFNLCLNELNKRMKNERKNNIITMPEYLAYSRTNLEIKKLIDFLDNNEYSLLVYLDKFIVRNAVV